MKLIDLGLGEEVTIKLEGLEAPLEGLFRGYSVDSDPLCDFIMVKLVITMPRTANHEKDAG